jgi:hypothetical protein
MLYGTQATVFGWTHHLGPEPNPRTIRNFPMQANGAEMLRVACCFGTENGIQICAPIHDAVLITAPIDRLGADVARMRSYMAEASRIVLAGFILRTEAETVLAPNHYSDDRGIEMRKNHHVPFMIDFNIELTPEQMAEYRAKLAQAEVAKPKPVSKPTPDRSKPLKVQFFQCPMTVLERLFWIPTTPSWPFSCNFTNPGLPTSKRTRLSSPRRA